MKKFENLKYKEEVEKEEEIIFSIHTLFKVFIYNNEILLASKASSYLSIYIYILFQKEAIYRVYNNNINSNLNFDIYIFTIIVIF